MYEAVTAAVNMLQATEALVLPTEAARAADPSACRGHRCAPAFEHVFLVTDGRFHLSSELLSGLRRLRQERPRLQLFGVAVGYNAAVENVRTLTCELNGITFELRPPTKADRSNTEGEAAGYSSYILNQLSSYYQMVAAPLARNHTQLQDQGLAIDVTWDLPRNPYGSEVMITIALPCFGDADSDSPSLLGVVAVDLVRSLDLACRHHYAA